MSNKKVVAISTIIDNFNLGNRLQNFALQKLIKDNFKDLQVETIKYNPYTYKPKKILMIFRKIKKLIKWFKFSLIKERKRTKNFIKFNENINFDNTKYYFENQNNINDKYDFVIAGSDQIWNEQMTPNMTTHLLNFVDKDKRISYAASLGKCELSDYEVGAFKRYLNSFKAISVREKVSCEILKNLTNNNVIAVPDPTLTISSQEWQSVEKKPKVMPNGKYALLCFLGDKLGDSLEFIEKLKLQNFEIVDIVNPASKYYCSGPAEFLYLIRNASVVATDSFHCLVFSIIYNKPFVHVERCTKSLKDMSSRIKNLEEMFKCKFPTLKENKLEEILNFKIENKEQILKEQKEIAIQFLTQALYSKTQKQNNLLDVDFNCSGCGLCKNICPVEAISYKENDKGFLSPVIDKSKCINCGKCVRSCSQLINLQKLTFEKGIYAIKQKEYKKGNFSSTGIFGKLAEQVLLENGVVFGVKYNKDKSFFEKIEKVEDLNKIEGSKYFQVDISNIYKEVEELLNKGKKVLVCATPCQITGLRNKFKKENNLILVQVLCHGVPSQKLFKEYTKELFNEVPEQMNFRHYDNSWDNYSEKYIFNNHEKIIPMQQDLYIKAFLSDLGLNDCCYDCHFAGNNTGADIIIGDCWGIKEINKKFYSNKGVSIIVCNTNLGQEYFEKVNNSFQIYKIPKSKYKYCNENLFNAFKFKNKYNKQLAFYECLNHNSFTHSLKECAKERQVNNSFIAKIKRKIKKILKI